MPQPYNTSSTGKLLLVWLGLLGRTLGSLAGGTRGPEVVLNSREADESAYFRLLTVGIAQVSAEVVGFGRPQWFLSPGEIARR